MDLLGRTGGRFDKGKIMSSEFCESKRLLHYAFLLAQFLIRLDQKISGPYLIADGAKLRARVP